MMFIHEIVFQVLGTITGPRNIGHSDLNLFLGQTADNTDSYSESVMYIHQIVFKI